MRLELPPPERTCQEGERAVCPLQLASSRTWRHTSPRTQLQVRLWMSRQPRGRVAWNQVPGKVVTITGHKDPEEEKPQQPACFQVVCCFCFVSCFIFAKEGEGTDSFLGLQMETQEWWAKRSQETDLSSVSGRTSYQWVHLAREWISRGCDQKRKLESSEMLGGVPARVGGRTRWSGRLHFNAHTLS